MPLNLSFSTQLRRKEDSGELWFLPSHGWGRPSHRCSPWRLRGHMLVFSLLSIPALRTVALPPSSGTVTRQGLQNQNSPSGETAEGIFLVWSQHCKGRPAPPAPHPVRDGLLQLLRVSKSPVTFIHSVAKMPERTSPHRSGLWASPREGVSFPQGLRPVGLSGLTRCSCPRNGLGGRPLSHPIPIFCLGISIGPTGMVPGACFTSSPGSRPSLPRLGTFHLCLPGAGISVLVCERGTVHKPWPLWASLCGAASK